MKLFKKIFSILFRISISIALLVFLFKQVDKKSLLETIKNAQPALLFFAFCISLLTYILCLFRWKMLLKALKIHLPLKRVVISYSGGIFFSLFLPSTIGGDLIRSIDLAQYTKRPREVVATVFLDRLSGYVGLVLLSLVSLCLGSALIRDRSVFVLVGIITSVLLLALLVLFNKFFFNKINKLLLSARAGKILKIIKDLHQEIHLFRHQGKAIFKSLILSVLIQASSPFIFYLIALALGIKLSIAYYFIFLPIIGAITLLPISIGGLGLRDATTIYFFSKVGLGKDLAFAISLVGFSFVVLIGALGGIIYVFTLHYRRLQPLKP